jgi:hypothetical protein
MLATGDALHRKELRRVGIGAPREHRDLVTGLDFVVQTLERGEPRSGVDTDENGLVADEA